MFKRFLKALAVGLTALAIVTPVGAMVGALAGAPGPSWLFSKSDGPTTFHSGGNTWEDRFDHGLTKANLGAGYQTFKIGQAVQADHWRHANHWMVDVESGGGYNAGFLRPDRSFTFQDGKLVFEAVVAAGLEEYGTSIWPELVVTTASAPTFPRRDRLYAYEDFAGHYSLGCRLQSDGTTTCAMYDNSDRGQTNGGRIWEISWFQDGGATEHWGGGKWMGGFRTCAAGTDADTVCRDRFRLEIGADSVDIFVNGTLYMHHKGLDIPAGFLSSPVYTYAADVVNGRAAGTQVRFHWDDVLVNGGGVVARPTPTPSPTPSPTATPCGA